MIKVFNKMIDNIKQVIDDPTNDHMDQETIAVDMLDGIEVFANGKWRTLGILMFDEDLDYRVKPNTKTLGNNLEIPLPLTRGQISGGQILYSPCPIHCLYYSFDASMAIRSNSPYDIFYDNKEDAIEASLILFGG